jgi:hypothetical protein
MACLGGRHGLAAPRAHNHATQNNGADHHRPSGDGNRQ